MPDSVDKIWWTFPWLGIREYSCHVLQWGGYDSPTCRDLYLLYKNHYFMFWNHKNPIISFCVIFISICNVSIHINSWIFNFTENHIFSGWDWNMTQAGHGKETLHWVDIPTGRVMWNPLVAHLVLGCLWPQVANGYRNSVQPKAISYAG